ncbi:MAG: hypothetical protein QOJ65_320, partial [Fimbriimonadaceae bacterium]|nr:hypothetical protein [Fimbriimonadaceae bacterium]
MSSPGYSESEAQEILRRASSIQTSGLMSRDEMLRAASELGITPEAVDQAEMQYRADLLEAELRREFREKQRQGFGESLKSFAIYAAVAAFLVYRNAGYWWISAI